MTSVSWQVPAKINLALAVGPPRSDGYHGLSTVFHAISLADVVTASPAGPEDESPTVTVAASRPGIDVSDVPVDATNLAARAAARLGSHLGRAPAVRLHIDKAIPVAGGLAGGSADAAGALLACRDLWDAAMSSTQLGQLAAELGSDVPFALTGGTAVGTGRGESLRAVAVEVPWHWVVVVGTEGLSAPAVYRRLDELRASGRAPERGELLGSPDVLCDALTTGDIETVAASLENDMGSATTDLQPAVAETLAAGRSSGALAGIVSGSGPTCVFLAPDAESATRIASSLEHDGYAGRVITTTGPVVPRRTQRG